MILADGGAAYAAARHRPLPRHPGLPARRQHQAGRHRRAAVRGDASRARRGVRRRHLSGRPVRAVQVGGPLGRLRPGRAGFDVPMDYEAFAEAGAMVGHGGIVVFDDTVDMARMARFAMEFCAIESCGKCTPCRVGSTRGVETIDRIIAGRRRRGEPRAPRRPVRDHDARGRCAPWAG